MLNHTYIKARKCGTCGVGGSSGRQRRPGRFKELLIIHRQQLNIRTRPCGRRSVDCSSALTVIAGLCRCESPGRVAGSRAVI